MKNYLIHYGVKGMKWGKHVKALDTNMVQTSRDAGRAQTRLSASEVNRINAAIKAEKEKKDFANHPSDQQLYNIKKAEDDAKKAEEAKKRLAGEVGYKEEVARQAELKRNTQISLHNLPYEKQARNYEWDRNNSDKKKNLTSAQVKASMDVGRAQSKNAAANAAGPGKTVASNAAFYNQKATAAAAEKKAKESFKTASTAVQKYDSKTQKKVNNILSKTTPLSKITYDTSTKVKDVVSKIFGKKGK